MPIDSDGDSSDTVQKSNYPSSTNPLTRFHLQKAMPPASTRKNGRSSGSIAWFAIYNSIISRVTSAQLRESVCSQARADRSTACTIHLPGLPILQRSVENQSFPRLFQGSVVRGQAIFAAVQCLADRQAPTLCLRRKNREKAVLVKPRELFVADVVEEQDAFDIAGLLPKLLQVCGLGQAAGENKCRRVDETRCGRLTDVKTPGSCAARSTPP